MNTWHTIGISLRSMFQHLLWFNILIGLFLDTKARSKTVTRAATVRVRRHHLDIVFFLLVMPGNVEVDANMYGPLNVNPDSILMILTQTQKRNQKLSLALLLSESEDIISTSSSFSLLCPGTLRSMPTCTVLLMSILIPYWWYWHLNISKARSKTVTRAATVRVRHLNIVFILLVVAWDVEVDANIYGPLNVNPDSILILTQKRDQKLSLELLLSESDDIISTSSSFSLLCPGTLRSMPASPVILLTPDDILRLAVSSLDGFHVKPPAAPPVQKKKRENNMNHQSSEYTFLFSLLNI